MTDETSAHNVGKLIVAKVTERDDGGVDLEVDTDEESAVQMANTGLEIMIYCAAYKVNLQDVLDWISSHKQESEDG